MSEHPFRVFSDHAQGSSHIAKNLPCQDYSLSTSGESGALAIVADGHGSQSHFRSAFGSEFASEAAAAVLAPYLQADVAELYQSLQDDAELQLRHLEALIKEEWDKRVAAHLAEVPFTETELEPFTETEQQQYRSEAASKAYGTTLLAAFASVLPGGQEFWFCLRIGDGDCLISNSDGIYRRPVPQGAGKMGQYTDSLCSSTAAAKFKHYYGTELPAGIFVFSDGVDDSFKANTLSLPETLIKISNLVPEEGFKEILGRISATGSGDDVAVAGILTGGVLPAPRYSQTMLESLLREAQAESDDLTLILANDRQALAEVDAVERREKINAAIKIKTEKQAHVQERIAELKGQLPEVNTVVQSLYNEPQIEELLPNESSGTSSQRRKLVVFYVVETSGGMYGEKINAVKQAIERTIPTLRDVQYCNFGVEILVSVIEFNSSAKLITPPESVETVCYRDLRAGGGANIGEAFEFLNGMMSRTSHLASASGHFAPIVILINTGEPTDNGRWQPKLERLKNNSWFKVATKVAITIEEDAIRQEPLRMMAAFTGDKEMVLYASDTDALVKLVRLVSDAAARHNSSAGSSPGSFTDSDETNSLEPNTPPWVKEVREQVPNSEIVQS
jgi:uncharacterized protein YegL